MRIILFISSIVLMQSCFLVCKRDCAESLKKEEVKNQVENGQNDTKSTDHANFTDQIGFYTFRFLKQDTNKLQVYLQEKVLAEGKLKKKNEYQKDLNSSYVIAFLSDEDVVLMECYLRDPLEKHLDLHNENGTMEHKHVKLQEAFVSLRVQLLQEAFSSAAIYRIQGERKTLIQNLKLN